jgi:hypothetical protein
MTMDIGYWYGVSKCDPRAVGLYARHYSSKKGKKTKRDWLAHGITPPGESITLLTSDVSALFVWLKQQKRDDGQEGINCAVFRNEGSVLSSLLILEAEQFAREMWGNERLFTYVDPGEIRRKRDPGRCFKKAGWRKCGTSGGGLLVFEKLPQPAANPDAQ